jgi:hypothetical protein
VSGTSDAWSEWRRDHAAALAALQDAQRAYHRDTMQSAVSSQQSAVGSQQSALESRTVAIKALNAARVRLDEVRSRMPSQ